MSDIVIGNDGIQASYACIDSGVVINTVAVSVDADGNDLNGYLVEAAKMWTMVRVDTLQPQPSIGWTYDGTAFTPPAPPADSGNE